MKSLITALLLLLRCSQIHSFSSQPIRTPHHHKQHKDPQPQQQQPQKENFHKALQKAGKTVFRPGGSRATRILQDEWCQHAGDSSFRVLELAAGIGTSGIDWARRRPGCRVLVTDLDAGRMRVAARRIQKRGLAPRVRSSVQDMFRLELDEEAEMFDVAMVEAALTHFPRQRKVECLQGLLEHCTSSGELLLHEICFRGVTAGCESEMTKAKKEIGRSLAIGFHPETAADWKDLVEEAGWKVTHLESGAMRLLNPAALLEEEGVKGLCRMAWNLLVHPHLRERLLSTKATLESHKDDIGYIIVRAVKKKAAEPEQ